jgi:hypothetical protein
MKNFFLVLLSLCFFIFSEAQKIRSDEILYFYTKLPASPLDKSIRNYQARIEAVYEEKNRQLIAAYEEDKKKAEQRYQKDLAEYPGVVKAAEDKYEKDLAEYNKKSLATKVVEKNVLGENNKPVKQIPPKPYLETIPKPVLKSSYDYPVLANTYLHLDGYKNNSDNAVQLIITIYGFDYTEPRVLSVQKDMVSYSKGNSSTYKATYYHVEFSYRHPMSVKLVLPGGKELMNLTPQQLNAYKIYKSAETEAIPQVNSEMMIKTNEEKILQDNLKFINDLVNDQFGFGKTQRTAVIYYVKEKGNDYSDMTTALNDASSGFNLFDKDNETARAKLLSAISTWNKMLKESNPSDKKARVDKDVTIAICFNLLEAYCALGDANAGGDVLQTLNGLSLSGSDRKTKDDFELLFADLKKRKQSNQL